MKIVHVTEAWNGGISTYVNTLLRHQSRGHQVALVYSSNQTNADFNAAALSEAGVQLFPYQSSRNPSKLLGISRKVQSILNDLQPDVVHLHSTFAGVYGRLFKRFPTVYCAHGWSFTQEEGELRKQIYARAERWLSRRTNAIINISQHEQQQARLYGIKAPVHEVVLTGTEDAPTSQPPAALREDAIAKTINLGFVGRLDDKKGFDILESIFKNNPPDNVRLFVLGEPRRNNRAFLPQNTPAITYIGWVENNRIDDYIRMLDAVIIPSRQEGFGIVVLEGMRNGKPAIVSNRGALPELVKEGVNGHVFNLADAAHELPLLLAGLEKEKLRQMGQTARQMYEDNFTAARFVADIEAIYRKLS